MANFPSLKTGAVAQYPSDRMPRFSTQVCRFLDGSEQRFTGFSAPLHRWAIRLEMLDESELTNLEQLFLSEEGRAGSFAFTDPWDGTVYPNCSFENDILMLEFRGPQDGAVQVVVRENR